jgi:uncharacterized protein YegJ (DUF2314 family)
MGRRFGALAVLTLFVAGCGRTGPVDKVTEVASDDARMNAAIAKARSTVDQFITVVKSPKASQSSVSVKAPFTEAGYTEHMWLSDVSFDGTNFHGTVDNEPEKVKTVKMGQTVSVARDKISDWMYVENGKLFGGETLRALREGLSPNERAEFDKSVPFVIE